MSERVTYDDRGRLDEVVKRGVNFHLEYMDDDCVWIALTREGEPETVIWLKSTRPIMGSVEIDP